MTQKRCRWRNTYRNPLAQVIILGLICFLLPGMFNAINGLGAVGKADATITDNANTALAVTFAVCSILAGGFFNLVGHRVLLILGGFTYILYIGSYLSYNTVFVISAGAILGVGAGFLWTAQGAIMLSYPEEENKGLYISIFWTIFNCGAIIGSVVSLAIEWHNDNNHVSNETYIAFMVIMGVGTSLTVLLLPPSQIQRRDGSQLIAKTQSTSVSAEVMAILKLFKDWKMLCLIPMFFSSNWFYTYQFNAVNGGGVFTTRTRGMNGTLYWIAQLIGSFLMGRLLDYKHAERRKRAVCGLSILFVATMAIWGGGWAFQDTFTRASAKTLDVSTKIDLSDSRRYAGPVVLYTLYGSFDAMWQTYCYWLMGALTNETEVAARLTGFYKAIQNAGAACAGQVDAKKVSYAVELLINWVLLILGIIVAIPVALSLKDTLKTITAKDLEDTGEMESQAPVPVSTWKVDK